MLTRGDWFSLLSHKSKGYSHFEYRRQSRIALVAFLRCDWLLWFPSSLVSLFQNESMCKTSYEDEFNLHENKPVRKTHFHKNIVSHKDSLSHWGKTQFRNSLLLWISFKDTYLKILLKCLSCLALFVFQGNGNSGVQAVTENDDKCASKGSADFENHNSANGAEDQVDSFDKLNVWEKQESHWGYLI